MEDHTSEETTSADDELEHETWSDEQLGVSFDEIVSFTMLLETGVTIIGICTFFALIVLNFI